MFENKFIKQINNEEFSCIVCKGNEIYTASKRGVAPILELIDAGNDMLNGAVIYDKVIGKAASMLLIENKISAVYGNIMSKYACELFKEYNIEYSFDKEVDFISNRTNDGMCPLESEVIDLFDTSKAYDVLRARIKLLMAGK